MKQLICYVIVMLFALQFAVAQKILLKENFNDNHNNWALYPNSRPSYVIYNGKYILDVTDSSTYCSLVPSNIDTAKNFAVSLTATHTSGIDAYGFGLSFGAADVSNYYSFNISNNGYYILGKFSAGVYTTIVKWTASTAVKTGNYVDNKIQVIKEGRSWKLLVNDQLLTTTDALPPMGSKIGVEVTRMQRVEFDDLIITQ